MAYSFEKSAIGATELGVLKGDLWVRNSPGWSGNELYRPHDKPNFVKVNATLVPYFAWDNRQQGEMTVWLPLLPH